MKKYDQLEILQLVMNNSHGIIWAIDPNYCLLFANNAYHEALKISGGKEMLIGDKDRRHFLQFDKNSFYEIVKNELITNIENDFKASKEWIKYQLNVM